MKLVDMTVKTYLDVLKSDAPAPGGGSVSALSAAQGAGLVAMVCDLTIPKEKYAEHKELCEGVKAEILEVFEALVVGIDKDTEAFKHVSAAFKLPKETDEEKVFDNLAYVMAELNVIHPFREGNGRSIREFIRLMAKRMGYDLNWGNVDKEELLEASILSVDNYKVLISILETCVEYES